MVSGYVLGYGGLLLLGGRAADLLGRRRVFLAALALFAVASLFGGLVSSAGLLIAARFIKGIAAAFTAPAGLSLLTTTFHEGPMRTRAISVYSAFGASGFSLGLVLSGLLTEISWRWTLLVPAPVALITLIAAHQGHPAAGRLARAARQPPVRHPGRRHGDRSDAAAGVHRGVGPAGGLGVGPDGGLVRSRRRSPQRLRQ